MPPGDSADVAEGLLRAVPLALVSVSDRALSRGYDDVETRPQAISPICQTCGDGYYTKSVTGYQGYTREVAGNGPEASIPRSDAVAIQNGVDVGYAGNLHHLVHGQ